ncbi:MAG: hypothetical protein ABEI86_02935 [Halobacteriaceae archaeon]
MLNQYTVEDITISSRYQFESEDELENALKHISKIDKPDFLGKQNVEIDASSLKESVLYYSDEDEENDEDMENSLYVDISQVQSLYGSDDNPSESIYIRLSLELPKLDAMSQMLESIIDELGPSEILQMTISLATEAPYSEYKLPTEKNEGVEIFGSRIKKGDVHYAIQDLNEFGEDRYDKNTGILATIGDNTIEGGSAEDFIRNELETIEEHLDKLKE